MNNLSIFTTYTFLIIATGTCLLAIAAGAVGCITVLKGESLIGDAIGHASFPGVVLAFIIFLQRDPIILSLGALVCGILAYIVIQVVAKNSKLHFDAILAVVLSSFFGLGMVLKSYIQGNPMYVRVSQAGLQHYIFGQASYMLESEVKLIFFIALISISLIIIFFKEIKVFIFDETHSRLIGLNSKIIHFVILITTMSIIAIGLKVVGIILISSLLIVPAITAIQWSNKFSIVMIISGVMGGFSAVVGTYISTAYERMSTGPSIILVMTLISFVSLIIAPHGIVNQMRFKKNHKEKN